MFAVRTAAKSPAITIFGVVAVAMRIDMTFSCGLLFPVAVTARVHQRRNHPARSPEFYL
jgi:hypothetical protein